jgi:His-Xaa-Ser system radical SAM maturase HxsB
MFERLEYRVRDLSGYYLLTNGCGEHIFLDENQLGSLGQSQWDQLDCVPELESRFFIALPSQIDWVKSHIQKRSFTKKSYLVDAEILLMVVPTNSCNSSCIYCQVGSGANKNSMSFETAQRFVDFANSLPNRVIKVEFQGGEPTLELATIEMIVTLLARNRKKVYSFVICTNLLEVDSGFIKFITRFKIDISTSLDGAEQLHNLQRPSKDFQSPFMQVVRNLELLRSKGVHPSALLTLTSGSVAKLNETINEYVRLGFSSVFVRGLNLYGRAATNSSLHISDEDFVSAYSQALDMLIELNLIGTYVREEYTTVLLRKILTSKNDGFVDLQDPCAHGTMCLMVNHDGKVYASDESRMVAEMGDGSWTIGNIREKDILNSLKAKQDWYQTHRLTNIESCQNCAYAVYCGADPLRLARTGPTRFCGTRMGVFDVVFEKIRSATKEEMHVLNSWAWG